MLHVDRLLFGCAERGLLEMEQRDLLPATFQRQADGHAGHQQYGHGQRSGHQAHVRLGTIPGTRSYTDRMKIDF